MIQYKKPKYNRCRAMPRFHGTFNNLKEAVLLAILIHLETLRAILYTYIKNFST